METKTKEQIEHHNNVCIKGIARLKASLSWLETVPFLGNDDMYEIGKIIDATKDSINRRKDQITK